MLLQVGRKRRRRWQQTLTLPPPEEQEQQEYNGVQQAVTSLTPQESFIIVASPTIPSSSPRLVLRSRRRRRRRRNHRRFSLGSLTLFLCSVLFILSAVLGVVVNAATTIYEAEDAVYRPDDVKLVRSISGSGNSESLFVEYAQFQNSQSYLKWPLIQLGDETESSFSLTGNGSTYRITIRYWNQQEQQGSSNQPLDLLITKHATQHELLTDPTITTPKVIHYRLSSSSSDNDTEEGTTTTITDNTETYSIQLKDGLYEFLLQRPESSSSTTGSLVGPSIDYLEIEAVSPFGTSGMATSSSSSQGNLNGGGSSSSNNGLVPHVRGSSTTNQQQYQTPPYYYTTTYNADGQQQNTNNSNNNIVKQSDEYWLIQRSSIQVIFDDTKLPEIQVTYQVHSDLTLNEIEYNIYGLDCTTSVDEYGITNSYITFEDDDGGGSDAASSSTTKNLVLYIDINESQLHKSNIWKQHEYVQDRQSEGNSLVTSSKNSANSNNNMMIMSGNIMLCARIDLVSMTMAMSNSIVFRQSKSLLETSWLQPLRMSSRLGTGNDGSSSGGGLQPLDLAAIQNEVVMLNGLASTSDADGVFDSFISSCLCNKQYKCIDNIDDNKKVTYKVNSQVHVCLRTLSERIQFHQITNWILEQESTSSDNKGLILFYPAIEDSIPNSLTTVELFHEDADTGSVSKVAKGSNEVTNLAYLSTQLIVAFFETDDDTSTPNDIQISGSLQLSFPQEEARRRRTSKAVTSSSHFKTPKQLRSRRREETLHRQLQEAKGGDDDENSYDAGMRTNVNTTATPSVLSDVFEMTISLESGASSPAFRHVAFILVSISALALIFVKY